MSSPAAALDFRRRTATPPGRRLWSPEDVLRWIALVGGGLVMCVIAWYVAAGKTNFHQQGGQTNLAIGGLIAAGAGHTMWIMRGRRAVSERRRALLRDPVEAPLAHSVFAVWPYEGARPQSPVTVGGEGMQHYHRADCPLAAGRDWPSAPVDEQEAAGRTPCGVCRP